MRLSEPDDRAALTAFCADSLYGTYILCRFLCYGNDYPFARCYVDRDGDRIRTALSVLEDTAVLLVSDATDYEELTVCLPLLGVKTVLTDASTANQLPFSCVKTKTVLQFDGPVLTAQAADDAPMPAVYHLIADAIPGSFLKTKEAYLSFLSDFTFRRNRGSARLKAVLMNDSLVACALTAAETDAAAVISGVACNKAQRGKGFGKAAVFAMISALQRERKSAYVIALNDSAVGFYRSLGFSESGKAAWLQLS